MKATVLSTAAVCALALAPTAQAKPNAQDASFLASAGSRALTEVNISTALLHGAGAKPKVRRLAAQVVKRSGHESRALAQLAKHEGLPAAAHGKRRGTAQVQHMNKLSGLARDRSYIKLLSSDLASHIQTYKREIAKGHDAAVRNQAKAWLGRLLALRNQATAVLARL
jgi:hypothetical protein